MTILVADDDHVTTVLLCSRLKQAGYSVCTAHDAMQTIMLALRTPPDAILLDVNMPGGTGMQVLRQLKNSIKTSLIPIIVISGSIDPEIISNVKNLGADEFISKPPDLDQLLGLLRRLLPGATASQAEGSRLK